VSLFPFCWFWQRNLKQLMDKCMTVKPLCIVLNCVVAAWLQCHHVGLYDIKSFWFVVAARVLFTTKKIPNC